MKELRPSGWQRLLLAALVLLFALLPNNEHALAQSETPEPIVGEAPPPADTSAAVPAVAPGHPGDALRAYVLTFTPGTHPFYKFGHNAILIRDPAKRHLQRDKVYNWGTFSFGDPALIPKFVVGRFMYWISWQSITSTLVSYRREGRGIDSQELDLDGPTKLELQRLLEENLLPENKHYKYDYYRDNCSTRVRDMLDKVLGGQLKAQMSGPGRLTYRQHTLRLTESLPAEYVALHLAMGDLIDKPTTEWEEAFIPMELQKSLRKISIVGPDGTARPLLKEEKLIIKAKHTPPPDDPPTTWYYSLIVGLAFGLGFFQLGRSAHRSRMARIAFGSLLSFFGLLLGLLGFFFLAVWGFTDHEVGYGNENLMLCVPWAIVLAGSGIGVARGRAGSTIRAGQLVRLALIASLVACGLKVIPFFDQDNYFFLLFFLPFWAGAYLGLRPLVQRTAEAPPKPAEKGSKSTAKPKPAKPTDDKPKQAEAETDDASSEADAPPTSSDEASSSDEVKATEAAEPGTDDDDEVDSAKSEPASSEDADKAKDPASEK